jgi:hypothetical protein
LEWPTRAGFARRGIFIFDRPILHQGAAGARHFDLRLRLQGFGY